MKEIVNTLERIKEEKRSQEERMRSETEKRKRKKDLIKSEKRRRSKEQRNLKIEKHKRLQDAQLTLRWIVEFLEDISL